MLVDDEDRENEGDLVLPAQFVTPEAITFMLTVARGYMCLSLTEADCDRLDLHPQAVVNTSVRGTPMTVSIDGHPRHGFTTGVSAHERARNLLERVGVDAERADDYAHEFSGGMKQRAMIAMSLACDPDLIIADEPTTALDVIVQDQVLQELEDLQDELNVAFLVISHDISVMAETCDRLGVMYGGKLMEIGDTVDVLENSANPYTLGLKNSFPNIAQAQRQLVSIPGSAPSLENPEPGCRFRERCPFAVQECSTEHPPLYSVEGDHRSACYRLDDMDQIRADAAEEETWL